MGRYSSLSIDDTMAWHIRVESKTAKNMTYQSGTIGTSGQGCDIAVA